MSQSRKHVAMQRSHVTEPYTVGHVISVRHSKGTFDFSEIVSNYGLKRRTV